MYIHATRAMKTQIPGTSCAARTGTISYFIINFSGLQFPVSKAGTLRATRTLWKGISVADLRSSEELSKMAQGEILVGFFFF